jgi:hypothetical protein
MSSIVRELVKIYALMQYSVLAFVFSQLLVVSGINKPTIGEGWELGVGSWELRFNTRLISAVWY